MKKSLPEFWVGVFVLAGIAAIVSIAFRVDSASVFEVDDDYKVYAIFENIGGLNVKAPVTIAGVNIGRVSAITVDMDNFNARVELTISDRFARIPIDSSARILTSGLLGAQYIGLEQGAEDIFLKSGDLIEFTQSSFSLEDIIGEFLFRATTQG
ncbi:MAG: outer membrane lipid asymmetry maintenance protein MlaD [Acidiferrobacterales bacterium]|nr:outer membrane lipid asymmetry maintenance protein MlaD [Acidiferrobacterales bacterium]